MDAGMNESAVAQYANGYLDRPFCQDKDGNSKNASNVEKNNRKEGASRRLLNASDDGRLGV